MLPMKAVRLALGELLAADAATLAPASDPNAMALIINNFAPSEDLVAADLDLATFTGSTPIPGATGAQNVGIDPVTLAQVIEIKPPIGGYRWEATDGVDLPQTIYGYGLFNEALSTVLAVQALPTPITLTEAGQFIDIDSATLTFVQQPLS